MTREEKIDKILEMTKEIIKIIDDELTEKDIDKLYVKTKYMLEIYKELKGDDKE